MALPPRDSLAALPALRGALATLSPAPLILLARYQPTAMELRTEEDKVWFGAAIACCLALFVAAWMLVRLPRLGRAVAAVGVVGAMGLTLVGLRASPGSALGVVLIGGSLLALIFPGARRPLLSRLPRAQRRARGAAWAALGLWVFGLLGAEPWQGFWAQIGSLVLAAGFGLHWLVRCSPNPSRTRWFVASVVLALLGAVASVGHPTATLGVLGLIPLSLLWNTRDFDHDDDPFYDLLELVVSEPARAIVFTFAVLVLAGGTLLALPAAGVSAAGVSGVDAFFLAASATTEAGLTPLDVSTELSGMGLTTLLLLIQVGGLAILTFSTTALSTLGARVMARIDPSVTGFRAIAQRYGLAENLRKVVVVTFASELVGVALLLPAFLHRGEPWTEALSRALFLAVSAFCNAGFTLQSDSLMSFAGNPLVLHTVAGLSIVGGLGPAAIVGLPALLRRDVGSLQVRIVLLFTGLLFVVPAVLFGALEWSSALGALPWYDRLHNAWFQSVTLRSAGFHSVPMELLQPATVVLMSAVMFVGGAPGSTAGGVKVTTFAILVLGVLAAIRGRDYVEVMGRRLPHAIMYKAAAIATMGVLSAFFAFLALLVTQDMSFESALFEVISALGAVGLSLGGTVSLDEVGKLLILGCMFAGRVGPLTLFILLSELRAEAPSGYPTEDLSVG